MAAVAKDFREIYNKEYDEARKSLRIDNLKHEEEIIYLLMQIVRGVYELCLNETKSSHHHKKKTEELTETYLHHKLPSSFQRDHVTNPVRSYIHRCIECLYDMCLMKHSPLSIFWIPKGDPFDKDMFDIEGDKDEHICDWTVWPAVVDKNGKVLKKGVIVPV